LLKIVLLGLTGIFLGCLAVKIAPLQTAVLTQRLAFERMPESIGVVVAETDTPHLAGKILTATPSTLPGGISSTNCGFYHHQSWAQA
jgi:hypothetical protein